MALKRTWNEEDHQGNDGRDLQVGAKRRHGDPQETEATNLLASIDPEVLKSIFREVIKEVIPPMLPRCISSRCCCSHLSHNPQGASTGSRALQLCFVNSLPPTIFTLANLTAEDGGPLQIELRYAESQQPVVMEEGSTMKVQICVLAGDFGTDGNEDWTAEEFNSQIVKPREGRGELLRGETLIKLEKGVAIINNKIVCTDNSCATRNRKFRLGVKVSVQSNSVGTNIREGRSEPFKVLDKRGEAFKKHNRPALDDKLWRLKHIRNGGSLQMQLSKKGIESVKDLLRFNTTGSLREEFGNNKPWERIIEHAKDCELDDHERYIYHAREQVISLVFNCIYEVVEVKFPGQSWRCLQYLNLEEKRLVERVKQVAYKNLKDLVRIKTTPDVIVNTLADTLVAPYGDPDQDLRQLLPNALQGQPGILPGYSQPFIPASCTNQGVHDPQPSNREMSENIHVSGGFDFGMCTEGANWHLDGLLSPLVQGGCSKENESSQIHFTDGYPFYAPLESENDLLIGCFVGPEFGTNSGNLNTKAMWYKIHKIRVALKWVILVKREAAARKAVLL